MLYCIIEGSYLHINIIKYLTPVYLPCSIVALVTIIRQSRSNCYAAQSQKYDSIHGDMFCVNG